MFPQEVGVGLDDDRPGIPAKRRWRYQSRNAAELRPYIHVGQVLQFVITSYGTAQHQLPYRQRAGIETQDKRRLRTRWKARLGAGAVGRDLRRSLRHIRPFIKSELDEGQSLDIPGFDALYAAHVQEQVHILFTKIGLHLVGSETAIRMGDIDHRQIEIREDIDLDTADGAEAKEKEGGHHH